MADPYDRLTDDFPHGTIDGERRGCIGKDCPAEPLTCAQTAMRYRSDWNFRQAYQGGSRGIELPAETDLAGELPEHTPPAPAAPVFADLVRVDQDSELARRREKREPMAEIARWAGMSVGGVQYRLKQFDLRRAARGSVEPELFLEAPPVEEVPEIEPTPDAAMAPSVPLIMRDGRGPRVVQLWVVLDAKDELVMGATRIDEALEYLAREVKA